MNDSRAQLPVYLDYNATAPLRASARQAITDVLNRFGNPSSVHRAGRQARAVVEDAREALARAVNATPAEVVFTSGATEANGLALTGLAQGRTIIAAGVEHPSVLAHVPESGYIPVDASGRIDLGALERRLAAAAPSLVAIMSANNETGVLQPVGEVVALARRFGALVHCDAVQSLGKIPLDFRALGVDSLALSGHKAGAAKGIGALVVRAGLDIAAQSLGGGQERRRRAGTENTLGIASLGAVAGEIQVLLAEAPRLAALRDRLEADITTRIPAARILAQKAERLPNTTCVALAGVTSETQVIALDLGQIAVSAGSACSSGKIAPSHVLAAMGIGPDLATNAIRVSLGWETSPADVDRFIAAYAAMADKHAPLAA